MPLPDIPLIKKICTPRDVLDNNYEQALDMLKVCYRTYKKPVMFFLDKLSLRWLKKGNVPYRDDMDYVASKIGLTGTYMLNLSYEWACTTTVFNDQDNGGVTMFRALDWPVKGMADKVVVAKHKGPAGEYWNITYPGFVGVLNGMAEGRFSIAINQAPTPDRRLTLVGNWIASRIQAWKRPNNIPPTFLLRQVFEECASYQDAVDKLTDTPLCVPAIFTIAGINPDEHCVIERDYDDAIVHDKAHCAGNHWLNDKWRGQDRPIKSRERVAVMSSTYDDYDGDFDWLKPPVLNDHTRLAFEANARNGTLKVKAMEAEKIVTKTLSL